MHLVTRRDFLNGLVAMPRLKRKLGLEIRRKPASFARLRIPPLSGGINPKSLSDFLGLPHLPLPSRCRNGARTFLCPLMNTLIGYYCFPRAPFQTSSRLQISLLPLQFRRLHVPESISSSSMQSSSGGRNDALRPRVIVIIAMAVRNIILISYHNDCRSR